MALNREKLEALYADLSEVCAKHGVILMGTCRSEGIYGEILVHEKSSAETWRGINDMGKDRIEGSLGEEWYLHGIGSDAGVTTVEEDAAAQKEWDEKMAAIKANWKEP